jgi:hypothetical protein
MGTFRAVGFSVEAYPVEFWAARPTRFPERSNSPISGIKWAYVVFFNGIWSTNFAIHEWIGLFAYRLTGRTDALFPAP